MNLKKFLTVFVVCFCTQFAAALIADAISRKGENKGE